MSPGNFVHQSKNTKHECGDHAVQDCNHKIADRPIHYKPKNAREGKNTVTFFSNNVGRELIVPEREPTKCFGIWSSTELGRLQKQAYVVTPEEKKAMFEDGLAKKQQLLLDCKKRTDAFKQIQKDQQAKVGSKLSREEAEAAERSNYVLQRAFELRQEQEDEVKNANSVILATKCLVVRQAQVTEKELMKKEWIEEERRLDGIMEQQRQKTVKREDDRKRWRKEQGQRQVKALSQQIRENEVKRLKELQRKEEESRNINRALIAMQRDDAEKLRLRDLENKKTRELFNQANKDIEQFKIVQKEEQRIADLRIEEFIRKKEEREAKREAELSEIKDAKEREKQRLLEEQTKTMGAAADQAELEAMRIQEEIERQWREKEKHAAIKKKQDSEELKRVRNQQLEDIRKKQALEIQKDKEEFFKVVRVQQELFDKDCEKQRKKKEAAIKHRKELLQQINEKELQRIASIKEKYEEGGVLQTERELRNINIHGVIRKKIKKLRENKVPENFVADIERQLKI